MTERRTIYRNADGVRRTLVTDDERPEDFAVHTEQVLDEILDSIERDRAIMHQEGTTNKLLARIPIPIYERAVHEQWDDGDWARWLNSSEAAPFRIWQGRV
jgi:hypothetical protein